jgi:cytoskeletal protein CcmA (bactofilin family)
MKKLLLLLMLLLMRAFPSFGIHVIYGSEVNVNEPVKGNLYVTGGRVYIKAPVHGDLVVTGGMVTIDDSVTNDIILAGGTVKFNGYAGDDIRCAGGQLEIGKDVRGDLIVAGGTVTVNSGVKVGNLLVSGGDIRLEGDVLGELRASAGSMQIDGNVDGDLNCRARTLTINGIIKGSSTLSAEEITLGSKAAFYNDIRYWTKKGQMNFGSSQKQGKATLDKGLVMNTRRWMYLGYATAIGLVAYLASALLMILLIELLFRKTMQKAGEAMRTQPGTSIGYGFLFFIAVPVAAIIALATVIGIPVGMLIGMGYVILIVFASAITSVVIANWWISSRHLNRTSAKSVWLAFLVFIILKVLFSIPFIGWLAILLLNCMAFGAILLNIRRNRPTATVQQGTMEPAPVTA